MPSILVLLALLATSCTSENPFVDDAPEVLDDAAIARVLPDCTGRQRTDFRAHQRRVELDRERSQRVVVRAALAVREVWASATPYVGDVVVKLHPS